MNTYCYNGEDFKAVKITENFKIGMLRFSERFSRPSMWERHLKTPEIFVLLCGKAYLYTKDSEACVTKTKMKFNTVYEVPTGEWHHVTVSKDACVLVVENADTSSENSEKEFLKSGKEK